MKLNTVDLHFIRRRFPGSNIVIKNIGVFLEKRFHWIADRGWQVVGATAIFLILFEVLEYLFKGDPMTDPFDLVELLVFFALLILVGMLINYLVGANDALNQAMSILSYRHDLSLGLSELKTWDSLITELAKLPGTIVNADASRLYVHDPISDRLEVVSSWNRSGNTDIEQVNGDFGTEICVPDKLGDSCVLDDQQEFCIPINYGGDLLALLQVKLKENEKLSPRQIKIFENSSSEIALALKVSQERRILSEMHLTKAALAERRTISTFIHDQLGQNLGYLHLKLDQISEDKYIEDNNELRTKLTRLRSVANDSYEIVRDILKKLQSETVPHLTNLLREQANTVSHRAEISLNFQVAGDSIPILPSVRQSIFFSFCEIIHNIEKHSNANHMDIVVDWGDEMLNISVSDNGDGFDSNLVQKEEHFGLQIMRERIANINGELTINSSFGSGTIVSISVPTKSVMVNSNE